MKDHANSQHDARSDAAMADACLVRPWWFLEFPEPLEARFRRQGLHRRLETITAFGGLAIAFFLALVLPDLLMTPSVMPVSLWMRLVVFPAVVIAGLWWIRRHPSPLALENMVAMAGMLAPPAQLAEFFGLWTFATRVASIVGPLSYGAITWMTGGNQRLAIGFTAVLFVLGLALLMPVNMQRGRAAALDGRHQP